MEEFGTITRRMKAVRDEMYRAMLTRDDFELKLEQLHYAAPSQRPSVCADLCRMFDAVGIACENGREEAYYRQLYAQSALPDGDDIELRIMDTMYDHFDRYPTPAEYMRRIVDKLSDPADGWGDDPLRLRILRQFVKYGGCMTYDGAAGKVHMYGGEGYLKKYAKAKKGKAVKADELCDWLDDGVFDVLATAGKEQKKPDGTYGLLRLADDLAGGVFKSGGATKRDLYMFAIVYHMTYTQGGTEYDPADIEKNLFEDYYSNNLMRFITKAYAGDLSAFELDPSGQGINYKNFAEMVYLYYIAKDMPAVMKLRAADEMIARLKAAAKPAVPAPKESTGYYTALFTEDILQMQPQDFEAFILAHYDCDVEFEDVDKKGRTYIGRKSAWQMQTSQETAFRLYREVIGDMEKANPDFSRENCNYGLWFVDVSMIGKTEGGILRKFAEGKELDRVKDFVQLLYGINQFMGQVFQEDASARSGASEHTAPSKRVIRKMAVDKPEDMTRTALMIAYYYRYNLLNEEREPALSFADVMDEYTDTEQGLNHLLETAGYQPISEKNIFDMALMLSSYAYLRV